MLYYLADPAEQGLDVFLKVPDPPPSVPALMPPIKQEKDTKPVILSSYSFEKASNALSGSFLFEESSSLLPDVYIHKKSLKPFMLLEEVLAVLNLSTVKDLIICVGVTSENDGKIHSVETRSESPENFNRLYVRVTSHGFQDTFNKLAHFNDSYYNEAHDTFGFVNLVHYSEALKKTMGVTEVSIQ